MQVTGSIYWVGRFWSALFREFTQMTDALPLEQLLIYLGMSIGSRII